MIVIVQPCGDVGHRLRRVDAERLAETAFLGTGTGKRDDDARVSPRLIISVYGIGEEYSVQNVERLEIAGSDAEKDERLLFFADVEDFDILSFRLKFHHRFALGKEQILGRFHRFQRFEGNFRAVLIQAVIDLSRFFKRQIQRHGGGNFCV